MEQEMLFHQDFNHTITSMHESFEGSMLIIAGYTIISIAILLHIFGIMLIIIKSSEITNQLILLMHLSFVSIILLAVTTFTIYKYSHAIRSKYKIWFVVLYYVMQIVYICNQILLTADRVLMTFYEIRYNVIFTRTKLYVSIAIIWMLAIAYGVVVKFSGRLNYSISAKGKASVAYSGFAVAFTFVCYAVILIKVKCRTSKLRANSSLSRDQSNKRLIPLLMVIFFFVFSMLPSVIETQMYKNITAGRGDAQILSIGLIDLHCLNHMLDPFVYIFLQRRIRKKLKALCCGCTNGRYRYIRTRRKMASTSSDLSNSLDEMGIDNKYVESEKQNQTI